MNKDDEIALHVKIAELEGKFNNLVLWVKVLAGAATAGGGFPLAKFLMGIPL